MMNAPDGGYRGEHMKIHPACRESSIYRKAGIAAFIYILLMGIVIQLIIIPRLEGSDVSSGLIVPDSRYFEHIAVDLAERIRHEGWASWQLRPQNQAPAGIAAAVYAATVPKPWTLLPLNAALHAAAFIVLALLLRPLASSPLVALIGALPLLLFPSAATWTAQIHKDGFMILGFLMVLLGMRDLVMQSRRRALVRSTAVVLMGLALIWLVRPYGLAIGLAGVAGIAAVATIAWIVSRWRRQEPVWCAPGILIPWLLVVALGPLASGDIPAGEWPVADASPTAGPSVTVTSPAVWFQTPWLPAPIDNLFAKLSAIRERFRLTDPSAGSMIDQDVMLCNAGEVLSYIPRALQITLLAPFPSSWFSAGTTSFSSLMRACASVEMMVIYGCLLGLLVGVVFWYRRWELWSIIILCGNYLIMYGLTQPNLGTLYRHRYPYLLTIAGVGLVGAIELVRWHRSRGHQFAARRAEHG